MWGYSEFLDVIDLIEPVIAGNGKYLNPDENVINKNLAETLVDGFRISKVYVQGQSFSDVPIDYPEYKEIEALKINSIYGGCGGGMFCPDDHLTKAEFAVILSKILNLDLTGVLETPHFSDVNSEDNGFLEIQALYEHGLIDDESLCGINLFCPDSILTREDLVYLLAPALIYHEGAVIEEPSSQVIADNNGDVVKTGNWGSSNVVFGYTGSDYNFMAPG